MMEVSPNQDDEYDSRQEVTTIRGITNCKSVLESVKIDDFILELSFKLLASYSIMLGFTPRLAPGVFLEHTCERVLCLFFATESDE